MRRNGWSSRIEPLVYVTGQLGFWYDGERLEIRCLAGSLDESMSYEQKLAYDRARQKKMLANMSPEEKLAFYRVKHRDRQSRAKPLLKSG